MENQNQKRKWSIQTANSRSIGVRLPNDEYERLKNFCNDHGFTTPDLVRAALSDYMDTFEEGGRRLFD